MKNFKLDTKSEKPAGAFFEDAKPEKKEALSFIDGAQVPETGRDEGGAVEVNPVVNLLKQLCFYLPGTFLLFFTSYGAAIIFMEIVVYRRPFATLPDDFPLQFALIGLIALLGTLMTWFGLGELKNRRHFAIPASLMLTGAVIGAAVKAAAGVFGLADRMLDDFGYLIYLLPLALIIPVLAKGVVDRRTKAGDGAGRKAA